jgi:hypothetical protein
VLGWRDGAACSNVADGEAGKWPQVGVPSSGGVAVWRCGGVAVWRCGGVAVWRCGGVAVWRCGGEMRRVGEVPAGCPLTTNFDGCRPYCSGYREQRGNTVGTGWDGASTGLNSVGFGPTATGLRGDRRRQLPQKATIVGLAQEAVAGMTKHLTA